MPAGEAVLFTSVSLMLPVPEEAGFPATEDLLHVKVTPDKGVAVGMYENSEPPHIGDRFTELVNTGTAFTVTVTTFALVHPFTSVPVTV